MADESTGHLTANNYDSTSLRLVGITIIICGCQPRGLGFDSRIEIRVLLDFSHKKLSITVQSMEVLRCFTRSDGLDGTLNRQSGLIPTSMANVIGKSAKTS